MIYCLLAIDARAYLAVGVLPPVADPRRAPFSWRGLGLQLLARELLRPTLSQHLYERAVLAAAGLLRRDVSEQHDVAHLDLGRQVARALFVHVVVDGLGVGLGPPRQDIVFSRVDMRAESQSGLMRKEKISGGRW
jgi:hypothetical protein